MLVFWGTHAIPHPPTGAAPERCTYCDKAALVRRDVERVSHFMTIPLIPRAFQRVARCAHCKRLDVESVRARRAPRRLMTWRIVLGWSMFAAMAAAILIGQAASRAEARARAAAPAAGDVWTLKTEAWPQLGTHTLDYGRARVDGIEGGRVALSACAYTSDDDDTIEKKCDSYPLKLRPVAAASVPGLVDRGAITEIWRGGDPMDTYEAIAGLCFIVLVIEGILTLRFVKRARRGEDPLPRAEIRQA